MTSRTLRDDSGIESVEAAIVAGLIVAGFLGILVAIAAWAWRHLSRAKGELAG